MWGPPGLVPVICPRLSVTVENMSTPCSTVIFETCAATGVRMRPRLAAVRGVDVTVLTPGIEFGRVGVSDENPGKNSEAIVPFAENTPMKRFAAPVFCV
jgi:hypothetical protein